MFPPIVDVKIGHILKGRQECPDNCAIALALRDAYPNERVSVCLDFIQIGKASYAINSQIAAKMKQFDKFGLMEPFTFILVAGSACYDGPPKNVVPKKAETYNEKDHLSYAGSH